MSEEITFKDLGLSPEVMEALDKMGVTRPTTVQQKAIPLMMDNMSVIAKAPTGTGKTFAFGIPIIEYLNLNSKYVQALILSPTRELAYPGREACEEPADNCRDAGTASRHGIAQTVRYFADLYACAGRGR